MDARHLNYFRSVSDVYGSDVLHRVMEYTDRDVKETRIALGKKTSASQYMERFNAFLRLVGGLNYDVQNINVVGSCNFHSFLQSELRKLK